MLNLKIPQMKHPGILWHYEKTKPNNNSNSRRTRYPVQRPKNPLNKIKEENFPNLKKDMTTKVL